MVELWPQESLRITRSAFYKTDNRNLRTEKICCPHVCDRWQLNTHSKANVQKSAKCIHDRWNHYPTHLVMRLMEASDTPFWLAGWESSHARLVNSEWRYNMWTELGLTELELGSGSRIAVLLGCVLTLSPWILLLKKSSLRTKRITGEFN